MDAWDQRVVNTVNRRWLASVALFVCAAIVSGCQLLSVAEVEIADKPTETKPTDLERLLAAGYWQADTKWSVLERTAPADVAPEPALEPWRWKFVAPDPAAKSDKESTAESKPATESDLPQLRMRFASVLEADYNLHSGDMEQWHNLMVELEGIARRSDSTGMTATILLARCSPHTPMRCNSLFEKVPPAVGGEIPSETYAAAAETMCRVLAARYGDPEEKFASAGHWLEDTQRSESVRGELFRGIARCIAPRQIPGLSDVIQNKSAVQSATPVHRAAMEACVIHAWTRYQEGEVRPYDAEQWPDGLWSCRFAKDLTLRKLFGRWAALANHPDALAVLKAQRLDIELGVREDAVFSLGLLDRDAAQEELQAVMSKGTDPEREAAIACLSRGGVDVLLRFARDGSPRVRAATAQRLGRYPVRSAAVALSDLLRDRNGNVQLAALEACADPAWQEHGRVSLLLHALRVGTLQTQMAALAHLRHEWGLEPIFPLNGTLEERDAAVRQLARDHQVSAEVFTTFSPATQSPATSEESLARQTDIRRLVRDFLHAGSSNSDDTTSAEEIKALDAGAVLIIEQELDRIAGPRAEFLYREVLPQWHAGYAALVALESPAAARRRHASMELRGAAEKASLSACLLRRLSLRMTAEQDRQVWQDVLAALLPDALPEAAEVALIALNSQWPDIRQFGCDYFERHPQPEYAAWLLPRLQDSDRQLRLRAIRILARCGNPTALDGFRDDAEAYGLRKFLTDSDQQLRWEAVLAMSELGDAQAAQELIRQSYDPHPRQRELAVLGMGQTGQSRFVEQLLRRSWTENDPAVQAAMLKALDQLVPMEDRPGLAPESSISDKIKEWARWRDARQPNSPPTAAGAVRPLR